MNLKGLSFFTRAFKFADSITSTAKIKQVTIAGDVYFAIAQERNDKGEEEFILEGTGYDSRLLDNYYYMCDIYFYAEKIVIP